jgi:hypothetical protein
VQPQHVPENHWTQTLFGAEHLPHQQREHRHQIAGPRRMSFEDGHDFDLLGPLQFDQHMLLGGKVKIERAPGHTRRGGNRCDVCARQSRPVNLGHRGVEHPRPCLKSLRPSHSNPRRTGIGG